MLSFRQLEMFRAVMVCGSISAAAQQLNVAQPTVTNTIRRLEDILKVELFDRTGSRLVPTRVAQQIFEAIQPSMISMEQLSATVEEIALGRHLIFRIGVSPSVSHTLAPRALRHLADAQPGMKMRMDTLSLKQTKEYLWLSEGDCAVTIFPIEDSFIVSRKIADIGLICLLPSDHPLSAKAAIEITDLIDVDLVFFHPNTPHGQMVKDMFASLNVEPRIAIETRFAETAVNLLREGFGIAVVDELTASDVRGDDVKLVPLAASPRLPVLLHHHRNHGSPQMIDAIRQCLMKAARDLGLDKAQG
ncbi:LysR family transcriptional regulator [Amorphus orientalis]|uniref:DNA-binding transcriptional LysR family regulator n=1 Tax=Amorphus orientalis TaxID=649198 RepID=A0AAE3VNK1_9HYPH|nr:LysR substrate-binding domain-containing protein [Amorphus orientalis]MDQ0315394.1 DNA-binding transcriptional LysR family regulator [Amorphus orientalis]